MTEDGLEYPRDQILATLYGQAVGDAIGLLTEFLSKKEAYTHYHKVDKRLEIEHKELCPDAHRSTWKTGDWTDDTDQMILILQSLIDNNGQVRPADFAVKLKAWSTNGFPELGDTRGCGIGRTTKTVMGHPEFTTNPCKAAYVVWDCSQRRIAPNGAVMRTSVLGVHHYWNTDAVVVNARDICRATHYDYRCQASAVATCVAISIMLKRESDYLIGKDEYDVPKIIQECYRRAAEVLQTEEEKMELRTFLECQKIKELQLAEGGKIGYTYKTLGSGFWALKQKDFRKALQTIVMEGGDADTNGAVAGALLGCKLGLSSLPETWVSKLLHKNWLDEKIEKYLEILVMMKKGEITPVHEDIYIPEEDNQGMNKSNAKVFRGATAEVANQASGAVGSDGNNPQQTQTGKGVRDLDMFQTGHSRKCDIL